MKSYQNVKGPERGGREKEMCAVFLGTRFETPLNDRFESLQQNRSSKFKVKHSQNDCNPW